MKLSTRATDLRLIAVFLMGMSVGICIMLVYFTWRAPHHEVTIESKPAQDLESTP